MPVVCNPNTRTKKSVDVLAQLVEAGFNGDQRLIELIVLSAIRRLKKTDPEEANQLSQILAKYTSNSASLRWNNAPPPPEDADEGQSLLKFPKTEEASKPFLPAPCERTVHQFVQERIKAEALISEGLAPSRSLLLLGAPGTGKTMLGSWLAKELQLPLVVLDLATSISSYLGKTGSNLRRVLDYARATPCVLFLDEFDSIAKKRNDASDVGELNRIVNVLLKELEEWPMHSVLIAATNHPQMLDPAIQRRFDGVLELPLPGIEERYNILEHVLGHHLGNVSSSFLYALASLLKGKSGSDLTTFAHASLRRYLLDERPLSVCLSELLEETLEGKLPTTVIGVFARCLKADGKLTVREIAHMLGKSSSTIQHHLKKT